MPRGSIYEVERIMDHSHRADGSLILKIHWKGYSDRFATWEELGDLNGCHDMLKEYLEKVGLNDVHIPNDESDEVEEAAQPAGWVSADQILEKVDKFRKWRVFEPAELPVEQYCGRLLPDFDSIMFINCECHYYVIYHRPGRSSYVVDGANDCIYKLISRKRVESTVGLKLKPIKYDGQLGSDHCGSSVVLIILELLRFSKTNTIPELIKPSKSLRNRVVREMHPTKGERLHGFRPLSERSYPKCDKCDKRFVKGGNHALAMHMRHHHPDN